MCEKCTCCLLHTTSNSVLGIRVWKMHMLFVTHHKQQCFRYSCVKNAHAVCYTPQAHCLGTQLVHTHKYIYIRTHTITSICIYNIHRHVCTTCTYTHTHTHLWGPCNVLNHYLATLIHMHKDTCNSFTLYRKINRGMDETTCTKILVTHSHFTERLIEEWMRPHAQRYL